MRRPDRLDVARLETEKALGNRGLASRMLWDQYVFRRGSDANDLWDRLFEKRPVRLLYIAGSGFDVRAQVVMRECVDSIQDSGAVVEDAKLVLIDFENYRLDPDLEELTVQNAQQLGQIFSAIGTVGIVSFGVPVMARNIVRAVRFAPVQTRYCARLPIRQTSFLMRVRYQE